MRQLLWIVVAFVAGALVYRRMQRHPATAQKLDDLERQSRVMVDRATEAARSASEQVRSKVHDVVDTATEKAQDVIGATAARAKGMIGSAASGAHNAVETAAPTPADGSQAAA